MSAMRFFKRRFSQQEESLTESSKEVITRKKRRREEHPKPWGKKERLMVFLVFVVTVVTALFLSLKAREWKLPGLPRLALPKAVLEETYVFDGRKPSRDPRVVIDEVNQLTKGASGVYGLYVVDLTNDENYGIYEDELFQAASLIKLPVMSAIYFKHENGSLDLNENAGESKYTYRELVFAMGKRSDNNAYNLSLKLLGKNFMEEYIKEIGLLNTSLEENLTTPRDIGIFFRNLWQKKIVERPYRDEILKSLTDTIYEDWLAAGITDVQVAHKFGREVHVINDAGIVFADNPYVLVVMSKGIVESEANKLIPEIAALVHRFQTGGI